MSVLRRVLGVGAMVAVVSSALAEETVVLDEGWIRTVGSDVRTVDLPDDFRINLPWDRRGNADRGFKPETNGVYRKTFWADSRWTGRRVFLELDGVQDVCDVFCNGRAVGSWEYGSLGFEVDLTDALVCGRENVVEVRCRTGAGGPARWYTGCGITRGAKLAVRNTLSFRRHGLCVTTPAVEADRATVQVGVELVGWNAVTSGVATVEAKVFAPDGREVGCVRRDVGYVKGSFAEVELPSVALKGPELWDLENPRLYRVVAAVFRNGTVSDTSERRFGIRKIEFSKDFGFRLNGRKVFLKGMANHQHLGALGEASYPRAWKRQLAVMREFGYNAIRCAHNPYPEDLLDLCDEMGILVVDELVDKWRGCWPGRRPFIGLAPALVREWVCRGRTHPCVVLWSVGNETQQSERCLPFEDGHHGITEYRALDAMVKRWDATRPTTVAMFPARANEVTRRDPGFWEKVIPPELSCVTEVASYNYVPGDYAAYRAFDPNLIVFQSEAAVNALTRAFYLMDEATSVGLCYWGAIEYWGESDGWPKKGWDYSFFRRTLDPHPQAWLVRSAFRDVTVEPVVKIGAETGARVRKHWNDVEVGSLRLASAWDDAGPAERRILVFSNAEEVELRLNGRSLGRKRNEMNDPARRNVFDWPSVGYVPGRLEAVAWSGEKVVARDAVVTVGPAVAIAVACENPDDWVADGQDLEYVRVEAVDVAGRRVRGALGRVTFAVDGAARFLAADDGDSNTARRFDDPAVDLHAGAALCIFRSTKTAGAVAITVDAGPLGTQTIRLMTKPRMD